MAGTTGAYSLGMCGRYAMDKNIDDLIVEYVADGGKVKNFIDDWQRSFKFSIAPTDPDRVGDGTQSVAGLT